MIDEKNTNESDGYTNREVLFSIFGIEFTRLDQVGLIRELEAHRIIFPINVDVISKLEHEPTFSARLLHGSLDVTPVLDSQFLRLILVLIGVREIPPRITGSDLLPAIADSCDPASERRVFLMGGRGDVAQRAAQRLNERAGCRLVVGCHSPSMNLLEDMQEQAAVADRIRESGATVVAVGLGALKQERWIVYNAPFLSEVRCFIAVGGTFDFLAGEQKRAPHWMRVAGLEWLYRLAMQPNRLARRYLVEGPPIVWKVLRTHGVLRKRRRK